MLWGRRTRTQLCNSKTQVGTTSPTAPCSCRSPRATREHAGTCSSPPAARRKHVWNPTDARPPARGATPAAAPRRQALGAFPGAARAPSRGEQGTQKPAIPSQMVPGEPRERRAPLLALPGLRFAPGARRQQALLHTTAGLPGGEEREEEPGAKAAGTSSSRGSSRRRARPLLSSPSRSGRKPPIS